MQVSTGAGLDKPWEPTLRYFNDFVAAPSFRLTPVFAGVGRPAPARARLADHCSGCWSGTRGAPGGRQRGIYHWRTLWAGRGDFILSTRSQGTRRKSSSCLLSKLRPARKPILLLAG